MDKIKVQLLREHPRNKEFFDDIEGERWKDFVESIKTSGIIVPLVVTRDYTVVSGNQRLRAAKELGLEEVPCEVKTYEEKNGISKEDWILKDLTTSAEKSPAFRPEMKGGKKFFGHIAKTMCYPL